MCTFEFAALAHVRPFDVARVTRGGSRWVARGRPGEGKEGTVGACSRISYAYPRTENGCQLSLGSEVWLVVKEHDANPA